MKIYYFYVEKLVPPPSRKTLKENKCESFRTQTLREREREREIYFQRIPGMCSLTEKK